MVRIFEPSMRWNEWKESGDFKPRIPYRVTYFSVSDLQRSAKSTLGTLELRKGREGEATGERSSVACQDVLFLCHHDVSTSSIRPLCRGGDSFVSDCLGNGGR